MSWVFVACVFNVGGGVLLGDVLCSKRENVPCLFGRWFGGEPPMIWLLVLAWFVLIWFTLGFVGMSKPVPRPLSRSQLVTRTRRDDTA